jgi:hypothetical protein
MNLRKMEENMDWEQNDKYPWRYSPLEIIIFLAATLELVLVIGYLIGG